MKFQYKLLMAIAGVFALASFAVQAADFDGVSYGGGGNIYAEDFKLYNGELGSGKIIGHNDDTLDNSTDAKWTVTYDDDAVELFELLLKSSNTGVSDNDYGHVSMWALDSTDVSTKFLDILGYFTDETNATEDSYALIKVLTAGTLGDILKLAGDVITVTFATDAVELGDYQYTSSNASTADNDYLQESWWVKNDNATPTLAEMAQQVVTAVDITSTSYDSKFEWAVQTAGTSAPTKELGLDGAKLYPTTTNGLDLGGSSNYFQNGYIGTWIGANGETIANGTNGTVSVTGALDATGELTGLKSVITITTSTVLTAAQCRGTMVYLAAAQGDTTITVTMPTLAAGYDVTFTDNDLDSGADLEIQMAAGDKINGGTAAKMYKHVSTAVGTAHFIAADVTDFVLIGTPTDSSNWSNDNN